MDDGKCFYKSKAKQFRLIFWLKGPNPRKETYILASNTGTQKMVNLRKFEFKKSATFVCLRLSFWSEFLSEMAQNSK